MKTIEQPVAHTPGPWAYHLGRGKNPRFHIQTVGGYQIASTIELKTRFTVKHAQEFEENAAIEANAHLIAAAPELLGALRWILEQMKPESPCHQTVLYSDTLHPTNDDKTVIDFLEETIAKAETKQK